ncbi:hypothetical protein BS78_06G052400 [Paspalum vaginatum]|nr:hypothetical protein BS78_06G052400 [Paspalum vaginatum]
METPATNPRRREVPTWLLSPPSSRSAFPATASASAAADVDQAVSEHPFVSLFEWWLARVEGDERKIAVGGMFERNQTVQEFSPVPIAKRHDCCVLETEDGIVLHIYGLLNLSRMRDNGFSIEVCKKFLTGFPQCWQSCNLFYPKVTSSHTGCQPRSSDTNNPEVDSTKFYLETFQLGKRLHLHGTSLISELLDRAKKSSLNLSNGAPRFEEYTSNDNSAINENLAALNDDTERRQASCNEVDNLEVDFTADRTLRERGHNDIDTDASSMLTVECANDAGNEEADNAPMKSTCNQRTPVAATTEDMPTSVCFDAQNSSYLSNGIPRPEEDTCIKNGIPRPEEYTCINGILTNGKAAASNDDSERYASVSNEVDMVEMEFIAGRRESGHDDIDTNALAFTEDCAHVVGNEESSIAPPTSTCDQRAPLVLLNIQDCQRKAWQVTLSKKVAADEEMRTSVYLDVQSSSYVSNGTPRFEECTCNGGVLMNEDAAASGDSERYAAVSKEANNVEVGIIVGSPLRDHDNIGTNVSLVPTVEYSADAANEVLYNTPSIACKKTPVASLKRKGSRRKHQLISSNEKPAVPPKKQRSACEKMLGTTRSQMTRSPSPYGHGAPLTRGRATTMSMSSPEDLKLRKTRSGRVVVPALNGGSQRIVYDMDGLISGVIGLDSPQAHKGSRLKTDGRKKRRAE